MRKLEPPCSYRLYSDQKQWLRDTAKAEGHSSEVVILRRLIEQAKNGKKGRKARENN